MRLAKSINGIPMTLRLIQIASLSGLYFTATHYQVFFGLKYAAAMTALWLMIEIAARMSPGALNNPMMDETAARGLEQLDAKDVGAVVAPVCAAAGIAVALLGMGITALLVSAPDLQNDAAILIVPTGPMMIGIPLYIMMGRLAELAKTPVHASVRP